MSEAAIHGRHNKKAVRKAEPEADPEFQIAPMIDILLVLLVFFMSIATTEVLQQNDAVKLPVAKDAKDAKKNPGQTIVNVLYNPTSGASGVEVDQQDLTPGELSSLLQKKVLANPQMRVLVRADKMVRYEFMRSLLESIGKSGVSDVTFSVVDKEEGQ